MVEQDRTSVSVGLDVNNSISGEVRPGSNGGFMMDQGTQTDQPPGPEPASPAEPSAEVDGK